MSIRSIKERQYITNMCFEVHPFYQGPWGSSVGGFAISSAPAKQRRDICIAFPVSSSAAAAAA